MKSGKHSDKSRGKKERKLSFYEEEAVFEYEDDEDIEDSYGGFSKKSVKREEYTAKKIPKPVYVVFLILAVLAIAFAVYMNRDSFSLENFGQWLQVQIMGTGVGDGYPVDIKGSTVYPNNFSQADGNAMVLSDTALTAINSTGKEVFSVKHSYSNPSLKQKNGNYILYDESGKSYTVLKGSEVSVTGKTEQDITTAEVGSDGTFALALQKREYASTLEVYNKAGEVKYFFNFTDRYITGMAMNSTNTMLAVCTVGTSSGTVNSKITVLDLNTVDPVNEYVSSDNMLIDIIWSENGRIISVGDKSVVVCDTSAYAYTETSYDEKKLTAYELRVNKAIVSVSSFDNSGACTVIIVDGSSGVKKVESSERVEAISSYGGVFALLTSSSVEAFDLSTVANVGSVPVDNDIKSISLGSESSVYMLGTTQIKSAKFK